MEENFAGAARASVAVNVGRSDDCTDALDALAMVAFLNGDQPYARKVHLTRVRPEAALLPAGTVPSRVARISGCTTMLASGDGWTLHVARWRDRAASVWVTARSQELVDSIVAQATDGTAEPEPPRDVATIIGFWHNAGPGGVRRPRAVAAATWPEIRRNYSRRVGDAPSGSWPSPAT